MSPDEFLALPPSLALRVLLEAAPGLVAKLREIPVPPVPKKPRYDFAIYRSKGTQWASETDVEGLTYWRGIYEKSAADSGSKYAAKDAKKVKAMDAWIAWRRVDPTTPWSGERNDVDVTAAAPSGFPRVHPKRDRGEASGGETSSDAGGFENEGGGEASGGDDSFTY